MYSFGSISFRISKLPAGQFNSQAIKSAARMTLHSRDEMFLIIYTIKTTWARIGPSALSA
jgi:hypothetical protein